MTNPKKPEKSGKTPQKAFNQGGQSPLSSPAFLVEDELKAAKNRAKVIALASKLRTGN